jgi:hypothetical protein
MGPIKSNSRIRIEPPGRTQVVRRWMLAVLLAGCATLGRGADDTVQVILMGGQSNMEGNAPASAIPAELRSAPTNVTLIHHGHEVVIGKGATFGPEVGLAAVLGKARPHQRFLLVKHAAGGTSMAGWSPDWDPAKLPSEYDRSAGPLYQKLLAQYTNAVSGRPARVTAVLWMQGESDSRYPGLGPHHYANLTRLIAAFRRDLGSPSLPFLIGQVNVPAETREPNGNVKSFIWRDDVRAAQARAGRDVPGARMIETDDLPKQPDAIHYSPEGQIELGRRYANEWLRLVPER